MTKVTGRPASEKQTGDNWAGANINDMCESEALASVNVTDGTGSKTQSAAKGAWAGVEQTHQVRGTTAIVS